MRTVTAVCNISVSKYFSKVSGLRRPFKNIYMILGTVLNVQCVRQSLTGSHDSCSQFVEFELHHLPATITAPLTPCYCWPQTPLVTLDNPFQVQGPPKPTRIGPRMPRTNKEAPSTNENQEE